MLSINRIARSIGSALAYFLLAATPERRSAPATMAISLRHYGHCLPRRQRTRARHQPISASTKSGVDNVVLRSSYSTAWQKAEMPHSVGFSRLPRDPDTDDAIKRPVRPPSRRW